MTVTEAIRTAKSWRHGRLLAVSLFLSLAGCFVGPPHTVSLPAIKLRVVDARTKRPLPGIRVGYAVETVILRGRLLGLIPSPEPIITFRLARTLRQETDESGLAAVQCAGLKLPGNEQVVRETVFVNLDVNRGQRIVETVAEGQKFSCKQAPDHCDASLDEISLSHRLLLEDLPTRLAVFWNPSQGNDGAVLVSDDAFQGWGSTDDRFQIRRGISSSVARGETIVVELEPAPDAERLRLEIQALERDLHLGKVEKAQALRTVAAAYRKLRLRGGAADGQNQELAGKERDAYRALQELEATNPKWSWKLTETFETPAEKIAPLREAVARFPDDHELRHEFGLQLCKAKLKADGLEQFVAAARLVPLGWQEPHDWYNIKNDAAYWCGDDCRNGSPCQIIGERQSKQTR